MLLYFRFLIGSPKERQSTDGAIGTAPFVQSKFDEQYASGNLYSCPLMFDGSVESCSDSARPQTSTDSFVTTNRNAFGLVLGASADSASDLAVSYQWNLNLTECSAAVARAHIITWVTRRQKLGTKYKKVSFFTCLMSDKKRFLWTLSAFGWILQANLSASILRCDTFCVAYILVWLTYNIR